MVICTRNGVGNDGMPALPTPRAPQQLIQENVGVESERFSYSLIDLIIAANTQLNGDDLLK